MLFLLLAALVVIAGCTTSVNNDDDGTQHNGNAMMDDGNVQNPQGNANLNGYKGKALASASASPYLEFNQEDYDKAKAEGKVILLNFYANWCPTCKAEQPRAIEGFNKLDNDNVVGFRVNYRDSDTESGEVALAKEFGISYQHTKIILDSNGERVLKSPENWDADRYVKELTNV